MTIYSPKLGDSLTPYSSAPPTPGDTPWDNQVESNKEEAEVHQVNITKMDPEQSE